MPNEHEHARGAGEYGAETLRGIGSVVAAV
jgi:hypothetical protein